MEIKYWAGTDVGRKRSENEDNFLIDKRLKLFVVADGMGGHASGEIASAVAVHGIREIIHRERDILDTYDDEDPRSHVEVCTLLEYAVHHTCEAIFNKARREPEKRGMGTTLVVLLIIGARGFIAYVGDSRIYLLRGGIVYQLTEDHSLKNELIRMGKITADEFDSSPYANLKNAMTRAVGVYDSVEVDTLDFDIIPGDSFLLCSDGLYEYMSEDDIARAVALPQIREVPGMLIDAANSRGGKDNITAVVVQVVGDDDGDRAAELNFTLDTLKNVPLFRELSYQQLVRVMNLSKQKPVRPGQELFAEGDPGQELLVVLRGRIELTRDGVKVAEISAGAHLGEMSLVDAGVRSATAMALETGKILSITRDDFYDVLRREPALAVKLLWSFVRVLAARLRATTADLASARNTVAAHFPDLTDLAEEAARSATTLTIFDPDDLDERSAVQNAEVRGSSIISGALESSILDERQTVELPEAPRLDSDNRPTLVETTTVGSATPAGPAPHQDAPRDGTAPERSPSDPASARPTAPRDRLPQRSGPMAVGDDVVAPGPRPRPSRLTPKTRPRLPSRGEPVARGVPTARRSPSGPSASAGRPDRRRALSESTDAPPSHRPTSEVRRTDSDAIKTRSRTPSGPSSAAPRPGHRAPGRPLVSEDAPRPRIQTPTGHGSAGVPSRPLRAADPDAPRATTRGGRASSGSTERGAPRRPRSRSVSTRIPTVPPAIPSAAHPAARPASPPVAPRAAGPDHDAPERPADDRRQTWRSIPSAPSPSAPSAPGPASPRSPAPPPKPSGAAPRMREDSRQTQVGVPIVPPPPPTGPKSGATPAAPTTVNPDDDSGPNPKR